MPATDALCCGLAWTRERRAPAIKRSTALATPNYSYEKRQRELAKKRKTEEKRNKKQNAPGSDEPGNVDAADAGAPDSGTNVPNSAPPPAP